MSNILSQHGNANQDCIEISSYANQKGYHQENEKE
jgi:hypothetical protein